MEGIVVEIAATGLADALAAAKARASRLELSSALVTGGVTPSIGLTRLVVRESGLPVVALLRPRPGGFGPDRDDLRVMRHDATALAEAGVEGIAFGITRSGQVDQEACYSILREIPGVQAVFHRAFDGLTDQARALEELGHLGFTRVLTSGCQGTAIQGISVLSSLVGQAEGKLAVVAAGGVRATNASALLSAGIRQLHSSCKAAFTPQGNAVGGEDPERVDPTLVADLVRVVRSFSV